MPLFAGHSTTYKYTVLFGVSATGCLIVGLICAFLVHLGMGHWVELFNGATWPSAFGPTDAADKGSQQSPYGFWFYVVLAVRTFLNLGMAGTAVLALSWLVAGGLERLMMSKLNSVYRTSNVMLVERVLRLLEDNKVTVPDEIEELVRKEAREFGERPGDLVFRERLKEAASVVGAQAH